MNDTALTGDELRELYKELILDHARNPRHFGRPENVTHEASGINRLCGDKLKIYLDLQDGNIRDAAFEGTGCAISVASASLLTDTVTGLSGSDALAIKERLVGRLAGDEDAKGAEALGKLRALEGVREFPSRVKCATLAWHALDAAINRRDTPATTE